MTDKEKEAIETLEDDEMYITESFYREFRTTIADKYAKAFETVLNLIQKQQEEIGEYEKTLDIFDEREYRKKYLEEERAKRKGLLYPDADEIYKRYYEQKAELEKKDKIIDLMAERLRYDKDLKYYVCSRSCGEFEECGEPIKNENTPIEIKCIKQYFERKVEGE